MARTKASRGVAPFQMRSGNSPLPFWGGVKKLAKKVFNATPIGAGINALKGGGNDGSSSAEALKGNVAGGLAGNIVGGDGTGNEADTAQKIAEIHEALVQSNDGTSA